MYKKVLIVGLSAGWMLVLDNDAYDNLFRSWLDSREIFDKCINLEEYLNSIKLAFWGKYSSGSCFKYAIRNIMSEKKFSNGFLE